MLTACYLLNRVPNKRNKTTTYELWYKKRPNLSFLRVWGCRTVVMLPDLKRKTLGEKESRDAIFDENRFSSIPRPKDIILNSDESQRDDHSDDVPSEIPEPCKALAAIHNLVIHQMDVKIVFLNGDLEEVYMTQPEGFVMLGNEHKVCKLVKSLHGLKQAPKQWHQKFDEVVLLSGSHLNQSDKCVYSKFDSSGKGVIICLYVDDMLIFSIDQNHVDKTKKFLSSRFSMKDMGEADVILGIKIKRKNKGIVFTQSHYIEKLLKKFNRDDCSPVSTPMDPVKKLKPNTGKPVDQLEYLRAIGCLMYAMTSTRPDIAYEGTMNYGLSYVGYPSVLEGYSYASWINHVEDSSSTKSEFVALAVAGKEAEWLRNLTHDIPIWPKPIAPISIRCDSAPTIARAYRQIYNGKSRKLGVRHSMVRGLIRNGVISIKFVRTQHNLADHLTNGLAKDLANKSVIGM
nr:zinc finger, CCHC-type [Tanacetum cinerariifolium]